MCYLLRFTCSSLAPFRHPAYSILHNIFPNCPHMQILDLNMGTIPKYFPNQLFLTYSQHGSYYSLSCSCVRKYSSDSSLLPLPNFPSRLSNEVNFHLHALVPYSCGSISWDYSTHLYTVIENSHEESLKV